MLCFQRLLGPAPPPGLRGRTPSLGPSRPRLPHTLYLASGPRCWPCASALMTGLCPAPGCQNPTVTCRRSQSLVSARPPSWDCSPALSAGSGDALSLGQPPARLSVGFWSGLDFPSSCRAGRQEASVLTLISAKGDSALPGAQAKTAGPPTPPVLSQQQLNLPHIHGSARKHAQAWTVPVRAPRMLALAF